MVQQPKETCQTICRGPLEYEFIFFKGPWIQGAMMSMMDRFEAGINPPGSEDAIEHDGLCTALPLMIQKAPNLSDTDLEKAVHIMTLDPLAMEHHKAEAYLITQFIQGILIK